LLLPPKLLDGNKRSPGGAGKAHSNVSFEMLGFSQCRRAIGTA
jgi:hypothetical protein